MSKFKIGQVLHDTLLDQSCAVLSIARTTVLGKMTDIYKCYDAEPQYGSYRAEGELSKVVIEPPLEPEAS